MELSAILLLVAVLVMVVMYAGRPFFEHWQMKAESGREGSTLLAEREHVLSALQELDFDHGLGKIPEEEYSTQRAALLQRGGEVLRKLEILKLDVPPTNTKNDTGSDKSGTSQKRFYKKLIAKADQLFDAHLAVLKAKKKGKRIFTRISSASPRAIKTRLSSRGIITG